MGPLIVLAFAALGWALWKGKLRTAQLPPVLTGLAGVFLAARGNFIIGVAAIGLAILWYRGLNWRRAGTQSGQLDQDEARRAKIDQARFMLGVSRFDNADYIRERHRVLIAQNPHGSGGSEIRTKELNEARDLLLRDLEIKPR